MRAEHFFILRRKPVEVIAQLLVKPISLRKRLASRNSLAHIIVYCRCLPRVLMCVFRHRVIHRVCSVTVPYQTHSCNNSVPNKCPGLLIYVNTSCHEHSSRDLSVVVMCPLYIQGYDISFLITNFHTEQMYKHKLVDFVVQVSRAVTFSYSQFDVLQSL